VIGCVYTHPLNQIHQSAGDRWIGYTRLDASRSTGLGTTLITLANRRRNLWKARSVLSETRPHRACSARAVVYNHRRSLIIYSGLRATRHARGIVTYSYACMMIRTYRTTSARHKDYVTTCIHAAHARTHARAQWLASMEWRLLLLRLLVDIPSRSPYRWVAARW
jgi:hypothetical protein